MRIIVGLGNPGEKYRLTRHNVGFDIIDLFRQQLRTGTTKHQHFALVTRCQLQGEKLILVKPQTFMNSSGRAVAALVSRYGVAVEDLYVVYDDLNLDLGMIRIKRKGSAGGHKGVKSIIDALGTDSFPRLRVGIGAPPPGTDALNHVLSRFSDQELEQIAEAKHDAVEALRVMILEGIDQAMNRFNLRRKNNES